MSKETEMLETREIPDYDFGYFSGLEEDWRESLMRYSDAELLKIFPKVKGIIPQKLDELKDNREETVGRIRENLLLIKSKVKDGFSQWFGREYIKVTEGPKLLEIDRQISRFEGLQSLLIGRTPKNKLTQENIQQALQVPIENIVSQGVKLRKSGKTYAGLCPFHQDKNPSFYIYPYTNSFYCYGCQKGGDVIKYIELSQNVGFVESVKYLIDER